MKKTKLNIKAKGVKPHKVNKKLFKLAKKNGFSIEEDVKDIEGLVPCKMHIGYKATRDKDGKVKDVIYADSKKNLYLKLKVLIKTEKKLDKVESENFVSMSLGWSYDLFAAPENWKK